MRPNSGRSTNGCGSRPDGEPRTGGGALNYITPAEVVGAVRLGRTATLAAPVETGVTPDNPDPGDPLCEQARRWSFLCVIAPQRLPAGTGSPVNPIAIL